MATIASRLRTLRTESGKTIEQVSTDTGIGYTALVNYENGFRVPRDEAKKALADYYGVTVDDIFFKPEVTNSDK